MTTKLSSAFLVSKKATYFYFKFISELIRAKKAAVAQAAAATPAGTKKS